MKKWAEILRDSSIPDDFVFTMKDGGTMSLGEMRTYDRGTQGELTARLTTKEKEIAAREKTLNDASLQLGTVVENVAAKAGLTVDELLAGKAPTKRQVAAAADLDESDPLVGSLVKRMKEMQARIDEQGTAIEKTRKDALGPMLTTYLEDYYEDRWDKLSPTLPKGAKVTREDALKYAQDNGYKDARGRLDLSKAVKDLTYEARVDAEAEKRAADLRKKDDDARVLAAAPRPSSLGQRTKTDKSLLNDKGRTKDFDEVLTDALADSDLWRGVGVVGQA